MALAVGHVLDQAAHADDVGLGLAPRQREHRPCHRARAAHVPLHVFHAGGGLDRDAAGVEGDALADEGGRRCRPCLPPIHLIASRRDGALRALRHAEQRAHAELFHLGLVQHDEFGAGALEPLLAAFDEAFGVDHVGRFGDQFAGEFDAGRPPPARLSMRPAVPSGAPITTILVSVTLLLVLQLGAVVVVAPCAQARAQQHGGGFIGIEAARAQHRAPARSRPLVRYFAASAAPAFSSAAWRPSLVCLARAGQRQAHDLAVALGKAFEHLPGLAGEARRFGALADRLAADRRAARPDRRRARRGAGVSVSSDVAKFDFHGQVAPVRLIGLAARVVRGAAKLALRLGARGAIGKPCSPACSRTASDSAPCARRALPCACPARIRHGACAGRRWPRRGDGDRAGADARTGDDEDTGFRARRRRPILAARTTTTASAQIAFEANELRYDNEHRHRHRRGQRAAALGRPVGARRRGHLEPQDRRDRRHRHVRLVDEDGNQLFTDRVVLTDELRSGRDGRTCCWHCAQGGRLAAAAGQRAATDGDIVLTRAAYSACAVADADGCPKNPSWRITAERVYLRRRKPAAIRFTRRAIWNCSARACCRCPA